MTDRPPAIRIDLQEANARNRTAHQLLARMSSTNPHLARVWTHLEASLSDTRALSAEVSRLREELATLRLDRANLAAAACATIRAHIESEHDPLVYLLDELTAQGFGLHRGQA